MSQGLMADASQSDGVPQTEDDRYAPSEEVTDEAYGSETTPILGTGESVQTTSLHVPSAGDEPEAPGRLRAGRRRAGRRRVQSCHSSAGRD